MADIIWEFRSKIPEAKRLLGAGMDEFLTGAGELVRDKAKENVEPGKGPGPHPHKEFPSWPTREDTGKLRDSIKTYGPYNISADIKAIEIGGDGSVDYGKHLEVGFHTKQADDTVNFWRYPWMIPALEEQKGRIIRLLRTIGTKGRVLPGVIREL